MSFLLRASGGAASGASICATNFEEAWAWIA